MNKIDQIKKNIENSHKYINKIDLTSTHMVAGKLILQKFQSKVKLNNNKNKNEHFSKIIALPYEEKIDFFSQKTDNIKTPFVKKHLLKILKNLSFKNENQNNMEA